MARKTPADTALNENALVAAVSLWLSGQGFTVRQALTTKQKGVDVIAERGTETWLIEAKGGTSSFDGSVRHGRPFKKSQILNRISKAFYTSAATLAQKPNENSRVLIALPDHESFRCVAAPIAAALKSLGISVLWVDVSGAVRQE